MFSTRRSQPPGPPPGSAMSTTWPTLKCAVVAGFSLSPKTIGAVATAAVASYQQRSGPSWRRRWLAAPSAASPKLSTARPRPRSAAAVATKLRAAARGLLLSSFKNKPYRAYLTREVQRARVAEDSLVQPNFAVSRISLLPRHRDGGRGGGSQAQAQAASTVETGCAAAREEACRLHPACVTVSTRRQRAWQFQGPRRLGRGAGGGRARRRHVHARVYGRGARRGACVG